MPGICSILIPSRYVILLFLLLLDIAQCKVVGKCQPEELGILETSFAISLSQDWDIDEYIVDNSAEKPKDWDDAAQGTWQPPLLKNPLYRGEWRPRKIPNPNYKGIWPHPQIANPEYVPDPSLSIYENISVIGLDLWQVRSGTIFDNFLITDDEKYAKKFGDETWGKTKKPEQAMSKKGIEKEKERKQRKTQKIPKKKPPQKNKSERIVAQKEEL